jgi:phage major head subunit gpT-like protein
MIINHANLSAAFNGFRTSFNQGFRDAKPQWGEVATRVPSTTLIENYGWLGQFPRVREWVGEKHIKNLSAAKYTLTNKDFESTVGVDRNHLEDDQFGFYSTIFQEQGYAAATYPDEQIFTLLGNAHAGTYGLAYDGQYFFDTDHPVAGVSVANYTDSGSGTRWYLLDANRPLKPLIWQERKTPQLLAMNTAEDESVFMQRQYRYGIEARGAAGFGFWQTAYAWRGALDATNYATARAAMMGFRSDEGRPLGIMPNLLVVPPALEASARAVVGVATLTGGGDNPWFNSARIVVVPWL